MSVICSGVTANRLTQYTLNTNQYIQQWAYNFLGNITRRTDNGTAFDYTYGDANHTHAVTNDGTKTYTYDANGNMLARSNGEYLGWDGDGNRVKKVVGAATTYYVGNYYELDNGTEVKYYYFNGPSTPLRIRIAVNRGGTRSYLASDHPSTALRTDLGSTSVWTNSNGVEGGNQQYYAYGANRAGSGDTPTDYQFTRQRRDFSSNLYQMGARWYDPYLNRWVQPDTLVPSPYKPQDLNRYTYTRNNPLRYTDPSGHICVPCVALGVAVVAKVIDYGWTAYDIWDSGRVLSDPNSSNLDRSLATLNVAMALGFEAVEPDDVTPVSLPLDDVARQGAIRAIRDALVSGKDDALRNLPKGREWMKDIVRGMATEIKVLDKLAIKKNGRTIESMVKGKTVSTIPDILDSTKKVVGEIKDVKELGMDAQIRAQYQWASGNPGWTYKLTVHRDTKLVEELERLRDEGKIVIEYIEDILP